MGNFYFYVEPTFIGAEGYHTSTVILSVYDSSKKDVQLDFTVKWGKVMGEKAYILENYTERHYHFTPSDIDLTIRATISVDDPKYPGVAYLYLGKIEMDRSIVPEIEGMALNMKGSFKARILAQNGLPFHPNDSLLIVDRPYFTIMFDKILEGKYTVNGQPSFVPIVFNFETTTSIKVRMDNHSTTTISITYKEEDQSETKLTVQFDTRQARDTFYIFLRLLRSIKGSFLDKMNTNYEKLIDMPWCLINQELSEEEDDPEDDYGYYQVFQNDNLREHLRGMVRVQHDLSMENLSLGDCLGILEEDLDNCTKQFRSLLDEGRKGGRPKNLAKYEKSRSALGELSLSILEDVKKGGKKKAENFTSPEMIANLEEEIKNYKESSNRIRKEIEEIRNREGSIETPMMGDKTLVNFYDQLWRDEMNQSGIHKSLPLFNSIKKYNQKLDQKLKNEKLRSDELKKLWAKFGDSLDNRPNETMEEGKRKRLYLQMISYVNELQESLNEIIEIKQKANDTEGKTKVIRALVYGFDQPKETQMSESQVEAEIDELEEKVRELEEENSNLDTEMNAIKSKSATVEREIKRNQANNLEEDLDTQIAKARQRIEELEEVF